jgi:DNA-binding phage protein
MEDVMTTKFANFMRGLEDEARAEGPEAVAQLDALRDHFRLGRQLAQARLKQKLSQTQVAERAQVDQGDVSKIERGMANPTLATLSAVAGAVGLEIDLRRRSAR